MVEKSDNSTEDKNPKKPSKEPQSTSGLDLNTEIGIEPKNNEIDDDSSKKTELLSSKKQLSEEQKEEVRSLFKSELEAAVQSLKQELKNEGQELKKDFLTIFGLFASFVTFLSIEVQVFKNRDNVFELIGISSISLSFVIFFALVINDISKDKCGWKDFQKPTYIMNILFAIIGTICLYAGSLTNSNRVIKIEESIKKIDANFNAIQQKVQIKKSSVGNAHSVNNSGSH